MLPIYRPIELAYHLGAPLSDLKRVLQSPKEFYEQFFLIDPKKPNQRRRVLAVRPPLSQWQSRFYRNVLLASLKPSDYNHGCCIGRNVKTNVEPHLNSRFVYKADISNFYPSIHDKRVYRLFHKRFGCPAEVADLCCRLCTHQHCLALGLSTSPIIADQILRVIDDRISTACQRVGWVYTRYVDDLTISANHSLEKSGVSALISNILADHGFISKRSKSMAGHNGTLAITGIRILNGKMDVASEYALELERQLDDAYSLTEDGPFTGPFYTFGQLSGRVRFVTWVNQHRGRRLDARLKRINQKKLWEYAQRRGLVVCKKRLIACIDTSEEQQSDNPTTKADKAGC